VVCLSVRLQRLQVQFELGHVAILRPEVTSEGHTHDWEVYVRAQSGVGRADVDALQFIERVQFQLHETYDQRRRTVGMIQLSLTQPLIIAIYIYLLFLIHYLNY